MLSPSSPVLPDANAAQSGPVELKANASPLLKLIGVSVFAAFWNGIVSVFLYQIWQGFERGRPEWVMTIFMIPFVAVGLAALIGVGYFFLNLFNPRLQLKISRGTAELGGEVELEWSFSGRADRIRQLTIAVEGIERARYRRGTDTKTDESTFASFPIVNTSSAGEIRSGVARCRIPSDVMHSFKASNNEIVWQLKVRGEIARFPDVSDDFPFTVLPRRLS